MARIDNDFPQTGRVALHHLLKRLVDGKLVDGWPEVKGELERIARISPGEGSGVAEILDGMSWEKIFDFCERLYSHLAQEVVRYNDRAEELELVTARSEVQEFIARELQLIFLEENLAFEFSSGLVRRRGRRNTVDRVARAELVLGDPRLSSALGHFNKALRFFRNISQPDPENVVKEAVCAVEAVARALFPSGGKTLGDVITSITGNDSGQIPGSIAKTFHGLYGFRSGGQGVGHGGTTGGSATKDLAEYVLATAASQIVYLVDLSAAAEPDVPF
ncbi:MAG: hypothetical protein LAO19_10685 [Acidobacteriia bacterium]|nr:hypothetical protein [Terriglobia bacterium]